MVASNNISVRIGMLLRHFGKNKNSFSKKIGIDNNVTIGRIINESRKPSYEVLSKIANAYPEINYTWLLTGEGDMLLLPDNPETKTDKETDTSLTSSQLINIIEDLTQANKTLSNTLEILSKKL